jgi:hypothetical protein
MRTGDIDHAWSHKTSSCSIRPRLCVRPRSSRSSRSGSRLAIRPFGLLTVHVAAHELLRGTLCPTALLLFRNLADPGTLHFPVDVTWLIAAIPLEAIWGEQHWLLTYIAPANDTQLGLAKLAVRLPMGWTIVDDSMVSPWAVRGRGSWPGEKPSATSPFCRTSGRPALLAGSTIGLSVEKVPRRHPGRKPQHSWRFTLTVTNHGATSTVVPALLTDGQHICWEDSVVILGTSTPFWLPGAGTHAAPAAERGTGRCTAACLLAAWRAGLNDH